MVYLAKRNYFLENLSSWIAIVTKLTYPHLTSFPMEGKRKLTRVTKTLMDPFTAYYLVECYLISSAMYVMESLFLNYQTSPPFSFIEQVFNF